MKKESLFYYYAKKQAADEFLLILPEEGIWLIDSNGNYICSSNTNTVVSGENKCINTNGIGGRGADSYQTPRSGSGGGFCGGFSDNGEEPSYPLTSDSGSSYAKE